MNVYLPGIDCLLVPFEFSHDSRIPDVVIVEPTCATDVSQEIPSDVTPPSSQDDQLSFQTPTSSQCEAAADDAVNESACCNEIDCNGIEVSDDVIEMVEEAAVLTEGETATSLNIDSNDTKETENADKLDDNGSDVEHLDVENLEIVAEHSDIVPSSETTDDSEVKADDVQTSDTVQASIPAEDTPPSLPEDEDDEEMEVISVHEIEAVLQNEELLRDIEESVIIENADVLSVETTQVVVSSHEKVETIIYTQESSEKAISPRPEDILNDISEERESEVSQETQDSKL